jgi:cell division protein FtsZ
VLIAASKGTFKLAESRNAMNTIRRYAADDAHVIYGTAYDESLGDQLRVTVIATGLTSARKAQSGTPPLAVVQQGQPGQRTQPQGGGHGQQAQAPVLRTGTDGLPVLTQPAVIGGGQGAGVGAQGMHGGAQGGTSLPQQPSYDGMNTPSVWRRPRADQAAAKVEALVNNGMDEIEIPAFLRKQAD